MSAVNDTLTEFQIITPSDTLADRQASVAILTNADGPVSVVTMTGEVVVIPSLAAGIWHPMRIKWVRATGTTATSVVFGR